MEYVQFASSLTSVFFSLCSVLPGFLFLRSLRIKKLSSLLVMTVFFLLLSFSFCILHRPDSSLLVQERILWLFFPFCLLLKYLDTQLDDVPFGRNIHSIFMAAPIVLNRVFHYTEITLFLVHEKRGIPNENTLK